MNSEELAGPLEEEDDPVLDIDWRRKRFTAISASEGIKESAFLSRKLHSGDRWSRD